MMQDEVEVVPKFKDDVNLMKFFASILSLERSQSLIAECELDVKERSNATLKIKVNVS
jgi:hypothetical protein